MSFNNQSIELHASPCLLNHRFTKQFASHGFPQSEAHRVASAPRERISQEWPSVEASEKPFRLAFCPLRRQSIRVACARREGRHSGRARSRGIVARHERNRCASRGQDSTAKSNWLRQLEAHLGVAYGVPIRSLSFEVAASQYRNTPRRDGFLNLFTDYRERVRVVYVEANMPTSSGWTRASESRATTEADRHRIVDIELDADYASPL
jgi:hypothetical protein